MEGLEASENSFSSLEGLDRMDSGYFEKEFLQVEEIINKRRTDFLSHLGLVTDGNHLTIAENYSVNEGVRYLRGQDISTDMLLDERNAVYIPESEYDKLARSHIFKNDVLVTIVGANTGCVGFVFNPPEKLTANCKLGIARVNEINPAFLYLFLTTKYGQLQIKRKIRGGGQTGLILPDFRLLRIVRFERNLELLFASITEKIHANFEAFKNQYKAVQEELLKKIGLNNWSPANENYSVKYLANSFLKTGRVDAEYYQPKYDELLSIISRFDTDILDNLVDVKKSIEPGSDAYLREGVPFIRVSDLSKYGLSQPEIFLKREEFYVEDLSPKKDTILLSKDGSVGIAYKVENDVDAITSGAILHLTVQDKRVLPDYLCLVLNSIVVQLQAERDAGGSIIQHWKPDEIKQVIIPILPIQIQQELVIKVKKSFSLQNQSKQLLDAAKYAMELAIEQNEAIAIKWLKQNNIID